MELFFLAEFTVARPGIGLLFWTFLIFVLFWALVGKFGFRPIKDALKKRENDIQAALDEAKNAREEMAKLNADNQKLLNEARTKAKEEANKIVIEARNEIEIQKNKALVEVKNQVGQMSIDIAEKLIRQQMGQTQEQKALVDKLVNEIKLS